MSNADMHDHHERLMLKLKVTEDFGPLVGSTREQPWTRYTEPRSLEEQHRLYQSRARISGEGADTAQSLPCPVCAAPDFVAGRVVDGEIQRRLREETRCQHCERSFRLIVQHDAVGQVQWEVVQTAGPEQPAWLEPKLRRTDRPTLAIVR